jgi:hypothetical protein
VLGLLNGTPMHGYELRKRLYTVLGAFRARFPTDRWIPACTSFRTPG